jgi:hypothetical protein
VPCFGLDALQFEHANSAIGLSSRGRRRRRDPVSAVASLVTAGADQPVIVGAARERRTVEMDPCGLTVRGTDRERWPAIAEARRQNMLVYLAQAQFDGLPKFAARGATLQGDIKGLAARRGHFGRRMSSCCRSGVRS